MQPLMMVHSDPGSVGPLASPEGIVLRTFHDGDEQSWADIVNTTDLGGNYDVTKVREYFASRPRFDPEGVFLVFDAGTNQPLATVSASWLATFGRPRPLVDMLAARPEAKGRGLGRLLCQAVLNYFVRRGEHEVVLKTDDHRIPAIVLYLQLGFGPIRFVRGEDHAGRWEAVFKELSGKCGPLEFSGRGGPVKVGVLGLRRGAGIAVHADTNPAGTVVVGCDAAEDVRRSFTGKFVDAKVESRYEALLDSDADAIIVASDCPNHAGDAIAAMRAGKDVLSEVTAFHTPAEGVALVETVEQTHRAYMMAENSMYNNRMMELAHLAFTGVLGEMQYAEGDYIHDVRDLLLRDGKRYWRSWQPPIFYCTHQLGPILRACGCRPSHVVGMHTGSKIEGTQGGMDAGVMMIQCSGGGVIRILSHFSVIRKPESHWICYYGTKATLETMDQWVDKVRLYDSRSKHAFERERYAFGPTSYRPTGRDGRDLTTVGHGGSDERVMEYWIESLANGLAMPVDVYEAADMTLPGILAHRSSVTGAQPINVPNLRLEADRDSWRADRARPDPDDPFRLIDA